VAGHSLKLTPTEYQLLELFMLNLLRVLRPELNYERIWGYDFGMAGNSLRVYAGYLRRKLESDGRPRLIHTARGAWHVLRQPSRGGVLQLAFKKPTVLLRPRTTVNASRQLLKG
jgi:DNA-binding response OmpR family regulator